MALTLAQAKQRIVELESEITDVTADSILSGIPTGPLNLSASLPGRARAPRLPTTGQYLGTSVDPRSGETKTTATARIEGLFQRKIAITHWYLTSTTLPSQIKADVVAGRIPHISLKLDSASVASGAQDANIRKFAAAVKALPGGVFSTYYHEPSNDGISASTYVKAWARFRKLMDDAGVDNAQYIHVDIGYNMRVGSTAPAYFPGTNVVDILGADIYNWGSSSRGPSASWVDISKPAAAPIAYAHKVGLPLFLGEWGSNENKNPPPTKATWFDNARTFFKSPAAAIIKGTEYFNNVHTGTTGGINYWEIDSSPTSLAAWRRISNDPFFGHLRDTVV